MSMRQTLIYVSFLLILAANVAFWFHGRDLRAIWGNVPPAPTEAGAVMFAAGDRQLAYRTSGIMLQNLGNTGGQAVALKDYNFEMLGRWFHLVDRLDPLSSFMPFLAAYYFGGAQEGTDMTPLVDYLATVGRRSEGEQWRWMAQAVFIARYRQKDLNWAFELAEELAGLWEPGRPAWMKQMPAFVSMASGDKEASYNIMMAILKDGADTLRKEEVYSMVDYICRRILDSAEAAQHPLCANLK